MTTTGIIFSRKTLGQKLRELENRDLRKVNQALDRLARRKIIILKERGDDILIQISHTGRKVLREYNFQKLQIPKPKRWDGKWRVLIFDIPEKQKKARDALRQKLQELGFYSLQESVFAFPYACEDEILFTTEFFRVTHYVTILLAIALGDQEQSAKDFFDLR